MRILELTMMIFLILSFPFLQISPLHIEVAGQVAETSNPSTVKKWVLIGDYERPDIKDVSTLTYSNYQLTFSYGSYYLTYRPYVLYNDKVYDLQDIIVLFPNIMQNITVDRAPFAWKYSLNITDIPANIQPNIQAVGFKRVSTNLKWFDIEVRKEGYYVDGEQQDYRDTYYIIVKDRVRFSFTDLLESGFLVNINRTDILITNIAPNIVNNSLYLDPSIELQEADTENLEDTYTDGENPNSNFGTSADMRLRYTLTVDTEFRSYIMYNLSQIINAPNFNEITEAILYLNHTSEGNPPPDLNLNVSSHYVNNTVWSETVITHNNQPCGSTEGSFNASCNETPTDTVTIPDGQVNLWYSWNVTDAVLNYNTTDNYISLILTADITGNTRQNGFKAFATKEWSLATERPILNVTYSEVVGVQVNLTSYWHTGISGIEVNGSSTVNGTVTTFNQYEIANITALVQSGFVWWRFTYNSSETTDNPLYLNMTANFVVDAYANATQVFITAVFFAGISSVSANSTNLPNNTATQWDNNTLASFSSTVGSGYSFYRYELPESEDNHTHFSTYTRSITANYTITAYALQVGAGVSYAGVGFILVALVVGFAFVLVLTSRKR